uniref:FABD domain-containing protein n=1 Tax=Strongyloides papillosus TaxID=174720 RepID=A0A0N5B3P1_STREA
MSDDLTCREDISSSLFDDSDIPKAPEKRTTNLGNPVLLTATPTSGSSSTPSVIRFQPDARITYNRSNDTTFTTYRKPTFSHMTRHGVIPPVVMPRTIPRDSGSENGLELRPSQIQQSSSNFNASIKPLGNNAAPFFPPKREFDSRQVMNRSVSGGMTIQNPLQSSGQHITTVIQPTAKIYKTLNDGQGRKITRVNVPNIGRIAHIATSASPQVTRAVIPIRQPSGGQISRPNILRATKIQATTARALQQRTSSASEQNASDSKVVDINVLKTPDLKNDSKVETKTVLHATDIRNGNSQIVTPQSTVIISCGLSGPQLAQQTLTTSVARKRGRKQEILKDDNSSVGPPVTNIVVANPIIVKPVFTETTQQNDNEPKTRRRGGGRKKKMDTEGTGIKEPPKKRGRKNKITEDSIIDAELAPNMNNGTSEEVNQSLGQTKDERIQESIDALFSSPVPSFLENLSAPGSGKSGIESGKKVKVPKTQKVPRPPKLPKSPKPPKEIKKDKEQNDNKEGKVSKPSRGKKQANEIKTNLVVTIDNNSNSDKKALTSKSPINNRSTNKTVQMKTDNKSKSQEIIRNNMTNDEQDPKKRLSQVNFDSSSDQPSKTTSLKDLRVMQLLKDHKASELKKTQQKGEIEKSDKKANKKNVRATLGNAKTTNEFLNGISKNDEAVIKRKLNGKLSSASSDACKSVSSGSGKNVQFRNESTIYNASAKSTTTLSTKNLPLRGILKNKPVLSNIMKKISQNSSKNLNTPSTVNIRTIVPEPAVPGPSNVKVIQPTLLVNNTSKTISSSHISTLKEKEKSASVEAVNGKQSGPIKPPSTIPGPSEIARNSILPSKETLQKNSPLLSINTSDKTSKDIIEKLLKEMSKKSAGEKLEYIRTFGLYRKMSDVEKAAVHALCDMSKGVGKPVNNDPDYTAEMKKKCEEKLKEIAQIERNDMSVLQRNLLQKLKNQRLINLSRSKSKNVRSESSKKLSCYDKKSNHNSLMVKNDNSYDGGNKKILRFKDKELKDIIIYSDSKEEIAENLLNETFDIVINGKKSTFIGGFSVSKHCKVKADQKIKSKTSKSFIIKRNTIRARRNRRKVTIEKEQKGTIAKGDISLQTTQNNSLFRHKRLNMMYDDTYGVKPYSVAEARFIKKYNLSETFRYIDSNQVKRLMLDFFRKIDSPLKYSKRAFFYQLLKNKKIFGNTKLARERMRLIIEHINKKLIETKQKPFSLLSRCEILRTTPGVLKSIFKPFNIFPLNKRKVMKCPTISNYIINSKIIHGMAWEHIGLLYPERKQGLVDDINKLKKIMPVNQDLVNLYEEHVLVGFEKYKPVPSTYYKAVYPILHPEVTKLFTLVDEDIDPNISKVYKNGRCYNVPGDDFFYSHGSIKERETPQYPQLNEYASPTLGIKLDEDFEKLQGRVQRLLKNDTMERIEKLSDEEILKTYELNKRSFEGTWLHNSWGTLAHWGEVAAGACVKADFAEAETLSTWLNAC